MNRFKLFSTWHGWEPKAFTLGILLIMFLILLFTTPKVQAATSLSGCEDPLAGEYQVVPEGKNYVWWVGEAFSRNQLCLVAWFDSSSYENVKLIFKPTDGGYNYWDRSSMVGFQGRSWDGDGYDTVEDLVTNSHRSVYAPVDIATGDSYQSNFDLIAGSADGTNYDGATGIYDNGDLMLAGFAPTPTVTLQVDDNTPYTNQEITFTATWGNFGGKIDHLIFFPYGRDTGDCSTGCPSYIQVINGSGGTVGNESGTGSYSFNYYYNYAGAYEPDVIITIDCAIFQINTNYADCVAANDLAQNDIPLTISGIEDLDDTYNNIFTFPPSGTDRLINEPQNYNWDVDSSICTITEKRIFKGYPPSISSTDFGTVIISNSGSSTLTFEYKSTDFNSSFYPYIRIACDDGSVHHLYNGSTLYQSRATGLYIVGSEWSDFWVYDWEKGGNSTDYNPITGSGAYFFIEKSIYDRNEPVRMKFYYDVDFLIDSIEIYPDPDEITTYHQIDSGSLIIPKIEHNYKVYYGKSGTYYPKILIKSTSYDSNDPSTYRNIWLGGNQSKDPSVYIIVTNSIFGASGFLSDAGIFGLDPSTFAINFGDNQNQFLVFASKGLTIIVRAGLYVASYIYNILEDAPFYRFIIGTLAPTVGQTFTLPSSLFGIDLPENLPDQTFTISYANEADSEIYLALLRLLVAGSVISIFLRQFF